MLDCTSPVQFLFDELFRFMYTGPFREIRTNRADSSVHTIAIVVLWSTVFYHFARLGWCFGNLNGGSLKKEAKPCGKSDTAFSRIYAKSLKQINFNFWTQSSFAKN